LTIKKNETPESYENDGIRAASDLAKKLYESLISEDDNNFNIDTKLVDEQ